MDLRAALHSLGSWVEGNCSVKLIGKFKSTASIRTVGNVVFVEALRLSFCKGRNVCQRRADIDGGSSNRLHAT